MRRSYHRKMQRSGIDGVLNIAAARVNLCGPRGDCRVGTHGGPSGRALLCLQSWRRMGYFQRGAAHPGDEKSPQRQTVCPARGRIAGRVGNAGKEQSRKRRARRHVRTRRHSALTKKRNLDSMGLARPRLQDGGLARAHGVWACAMRAPQGKFHRSETRQCRGGGLNLGSHLTVGRGTTIHEHGLRLS
jgi:hypothetical protein